MLHDAPNRLFDPYLNIMPKQKSHSGASKRFKKTASGRYKHKRQGRRHILTKKSPKRKRQLRKDGMVDKADEQRVKRMLDC